MPGHICSELESVIKLFIFWSAGEACLWWGDSPQGSAPQWRLWGTGWTLHLAGSLILYTPLPPFCGSGENGQGARGRQWGYLNGPIKCIYREENSYNYFKGINVFLDSVLLWRRWVPRFGCRMEQGGLVWVFVPTAHWGYWGSPDECGGGSFYNNTLNIGMSGVCLEYLQLFSSCCTFPPLLTLVAFSKVPTHLGSAPVQTLSR